ncbi:TULIP family P47-like protein [Pseudomonas rubra]|uniref:TULIP family P47-like protein n=1 Tax=Pseudomonas rubra TaxID=2942627 RepID=A0ABT5P2S5_9PSED|nr:TULIP family P47-like protein [Pseudomonas rubra]MDD1012581.1 TULIP family P47-like protein [Pseudomonas rubra]MDD1041406.1 TULIP family P47-like protein [Pseudomonas rubra]MDD1153819.1 TULIP family P47-like protein [Pseudomonas rubra]
MSSADNVILSGLSQPASLTLSHLDETLRSTLKSSLLYKNAERVVEQPAEADMLGLASSVTTNGWDTVSICRVSALNERIKLEKTYPANIESSIDTFSLKADFAPWAISTGGDGRNVKVRIPLKSGSYKGLSGKTYDIAGVSVEAYVKLSYFPLPAPNVAKDGTYKLEVNTKIVDPSDPIAAVISLRDPNNVLDTVNQSLLRGIIEGWLNKPENLAKFDTLFSTVVINNMGKESEDYKWLRGTAMSYAYTDKSTEESSIFGVLCMTNERDYSGLPNQLPAVSLEQDNNSMFLISREIFVKYQLLPSLPFIFKDTNSSNYTVDAAGTTITAKGLKLDSIKYGAVTYYPVVENFDINFDETYIRTEARIRTDISPGVVAYTRIVTKQTLELGENSKGEQIMVYSMVGDPDVQNNVDIATWVVVTEIIVAAIAAVATAVAGGVGGKIAALIVGIIAAVIVAVVGLIIHVIIEKVIAGGVTDEIPSIAPMVKVAANQVKWPFCEPDAFVLTGISYNGALIFNGSLKLLEKFQIRNKRLTLAALTA